MVSLRTRQLISASANYSDKKTIKKSRTKVLGLKQEEFIIAAKAQGMKDRRILFVHLLPNSLSPIIVQGPWVLRPLS
ncbi:oligopeptide ABC transporter-like protein [Paenibacillus larvae subsp. larvae B-3650]|nr:oligopeptide ABC transporter-like protein [Paenibacillus larvae subsp. larvae B-3650]